MQRIFISTKKLISICLVTLLLFVSTLTISPAPAKADVVILKCESDCTAAFTVGMVAGSAVTLAATGSDAGLAAGAGAAGMTAIVDTAAAAAPFVAAAAAAAAPVVVPVAIGTAAIGGAYLLWQHFSHPSTH